MSDFPIVITADGLQPTSPAALRALVVGLVSASNPGYTADLPGSLIEDMVSTEVGSLTVADSAKVDLVNSLTPLGANLPLLIELGQLYGVEQGQNTNTSVEVVFSTSTSPGFVINAGFTVSDGTYQYTVQDPVIIPTSGSTGLVYCLATVAGTWAVPANSVTEIITSLPLTTVITVTNPSTGVPGSGAQSEEDYRSDVIQAGQAMATGMPALLKTLLGEVSGVQQRLVAVKQQPAPAGGWEVIVGGGDPYSVAFAIFQALFDVSTLVGSQLLVTGITNANPGVMTTNLNHGFTTGQVINVTGVVGTSGINGVPLTITVINQTQFSLGIDTTSSGAWVSGGLVTPNLRNVSVSINSYPDTYTVPFVQPPQQTVTISLLWNSNYPNYVSPASVAALGGPAILTYVNSISVGQPMNVFELNAVFQAAVVTLIPTSFLNRMVFTVNINGVTVAPVSGTGSINGDPESYFFATLAGISILQG